MHLMDLLAVKNLPILDNFYHIFVLEDTSNIMFSYDHKRIVTRSV